MIQSRKILEQIDFLQNIDEVWALNSLYDEGLMTRIFWESISKYFSTQSELEKQKCLTKCKIINSYFGSSLPVSSKINQFVTPHGFHGIFISQEATIGKNCVIFQNVTIGSNTLANSKSGGAPTIGDNVYIGAGAMIIGNVKIGNNVRIGAGCFVNKNVEDNCTVIQSLPTLKKHNKILDNTFYTINDYLKAQSTAHKGGGSGLYRVMDESAQKNYDKAFKILFCGDLILLEDQVKRAYKNSGRYDFENLFEYTRKYISEADFSIGVFEGPCGGTSKSYSQSNCDDGKTLYINFPDEFAEAVKNAGFNFIHPNATEGVRMYSEAVLHS